ncbi:acyl-CoA dehydrogenase [Streptomyces sp. Je 1-4]|uniref:acyl-CoA dehydrogenase n=1 Tax=Streptomyces TaxID=1883 RepID=UPI0021DA10FD|nr:MULTISPECIES: acyl-CoA dehydrogenase [unclassified Streptomyces]UYB43739.1 acyl-CoA dehydrogenase [Streptomyces sp. Je 1-4]UZQ40146.1 acyl-CoA dehydrogenase [Streptomyces sp. Je 1-4] [Streptomyces sp. Je 1-4 4N24]UZQ47563.1 acyl-CoA dehydrogenase [Streptomyces sp. Je 1-4] [Streptomyces sp. Je 1-4 4N24_ara]
MTTDATFSAGVGARPGGPSAGPPSPAERCRTVARRFTALVDGGDLRLPFPGEGRTRERFRALAALGREDLCVARLAEGHVDAAAILHELDGPPPEPGERWGVWAAHPPGPGLTVTARGGGWWLNGVKPYCSGVHSCTHALVTADSDQGRRLFAARVGDPAIAPVPGTWQAVGMAGSDSPDATFTEVPATPVGDAGSYLRRPGFQHGGIGVAACWLGGAQAVAATLVAGAEAGHRPLDAHAAAHLGEVDVLLHAAESVLQRAADEIDEDPLDRLGGARMRSLRVRALVEKVCTDVLRHVGQATGAEPLCHDARHARAVADLTVYLRQHHAERNHAELGLLLTGQAEER